MSIIIFVCQLHNQKLNNNKVVRVVNRQDNFKMSFTCAWWHCLLIFLDTLTKTLVFQRTIANNH